MHMFNNVITYIKKNRTIIYILLASFIFRLLFSLDNNKTLFCDISAYDSFALNVFKTGAYPSGLYFAPAYPFFAGYIYKILGYGYTNVYMVQTILGTCNTLLIYLIAKDIFDERLGLASAAASLLYWPLTLYSGILQSEILFLFLLLSGFYFLLRGLSTHKVIYFIPCGLLFALSTLTRSINLLLVFLIPAAYFVFSYKQLKKFIINSVVFVVTFCLVMSPWVIRNYNLYHAFIPVDSLSGLNLYIGNNEKANGFFVDITNQYPLNDPKLDNIEIDNITKKLAVDYIEQHPIRAAGLTIWRGLLFVGLDIGEVDWVLTKYMSQNIFFHYEPWYVLIYISDLLFFILAVLGLPKLLKTQKSMVLLGFIFYYFALTSLFYIQARYRLPVMPFMAIAAAFSTEKFFPRLYSAL